MSSIIFRVDSSIHIASGHVFRCLTLAEYYKSEGCDVLFISRDLHGNFNESIRVRGFELIELPRPNEEFKSTENFDNFLEVPWYVDAKQTLDAVSDFGHNNFRLLIVDHYSIDIQWEIMVAPHVSRILVIDDLADRQHNCDILIDNTIGRMITDYAGLLPMKCQAFLGLKYAVLREEFFDNSDAFSSFSTQKKNLLIYFGGVDKDQLTLQIIEVLLKHGYHSRCNIQALLGKKGPQFDALERYKNYITVECGIFDMRSIYRNTDICIGAGGTSALERCAIGVPSICFAIAENQRLAVARLSLAGAILSIGEEMPLENNLCNQLEKLLNNTFVAQNLSENAMKLMKPNRVRSIIKQSIQY